VCSDAVHFAALRGDFEPQLEPLGTPAAAPRLNGFLVAYGWLKPIAAEGFVWITAEASSARALRQHAAERMRHPLQWPKASGLDQGRG
jgi:NADPH-dependent ferric siderophore reductase